MRLKVILSGQGESTLVPQDYRRYFISFLKSVFSEIGRFHDLYEAKRLKPFTFSVYFGNIFDSKEISKEGFIKTGPNLGFLFSTGDPEIFINFYNGVLKLKERNYHLEIKRQKILIKEISIVNKKVSFNEPCTLFKTIGICILTDPEVNAKDFHRWYVVPNEDNLEKFNKILTKRMQSKYQLIHGKRLSCKVEVIPRVGNSIKEVIVKHYGGYLKGFKGVFYINSHPEMLRFIYDYGLGVRTGQGFGLLEVIEEGP